MVWTTAAVFNTSTAVGGETVFDVLGGFTLTEKHNISGLIRIHYRLVHRSATAGLSHSGAMGVGVVQDDALALANVNDPFTQGAGSWPMHRFFMDERVDAVSGVVEGDSRVRRRIPIDASLFFALEVNSASAAPVEWSVSLRVLLQRGR